MQASDEDRLNMSASLPGPLRELVVIALRERILSGELAPGAKLVEDSIAKEFGVSRGPVREAMRELAREGLVTELSRRGAFVSTLSRQDLSEVYDVREALELSACKVTSARASDAELLGLEKHLVELEQSWSRGAFYLECAAHDLAFHRSLVALAGNERMASMYEQMLAQTVLLLRVAAEESPRLHEEMRASAHRDIFDSLVARDVKRARRAVEVHYVYAAERLFKGTPSREMPRANP